MELPLLGDQSADLWWKNAVFYCLDVETFQDSDGDGVGDFAGLCSRLDYLAWLGVTGIWLLPFHPSPNGDDGYDVSDFYDIDARFGNLGDFTVMLRAARERGIRVVTDLVVNHTSTEHPWFQAARSSPDSPFRNWYVWSDEEPEQPAEVVFPGEVDRAWTYDAAAGAWYLHRFYPFQADLNMAEPAVRREIEKIMGFWLELGVSGFRFDAVPFVIEDLGVEDQAPRDPHAYLRQFRAFAARRRGDVMLLGEANLEPDVQRDYFGQGTGDEMNMLFNYVGNAALTLALARRRGEPLRRYLDTLPDIPLTCQWLTFARIHDELNLERLGDAERDEVFSVLAPREEERIYGRGLRRRHAPMLDGDPRRLRLLMSLVLSMPGAPCIFYGDELGVGDRLDLPGRLAVRTPMQWSGERNGGFSSAPADRLVRPTVDDDELGWKAVNVARQQRDPDSQLSWTARLVGVRRQCPELGFGDWRTLPPGDDALFAHRADWQGSTVVIVHNLSDQACEARLPRGEGFDVLVEVIADRDYGAEVVECDRVPVGPYGFRWFRSQGRGGASS